MFFLVSKIFGYLLAPITWIIILIFLAVICNNQRKRRWLLFASLSVTLLFSNSFIGDEFIRGWEVPIHIVDSSSHYDIGVLLGGDIVTYDNENQRVIFRSGADRLMQVINLYHHKIIDTIMITGGSGHLLYPDRTEANYIKTYLVDIGIPEKDIIVDIIARNTYQNALEVAEMLRVNHNHEKVLLITSALHMRRASACFTKQGIGHDKYSTSQITGNRLFDIDHLLMPSALALKNWDLLIHEWIGFLTYKILGYC